MERRSGKNIGRKIEEIREAGMCFWWMGSSEASSLSLTGKGTLEPMGNDVENYVGTSGRETRMPDEEFSADL